MLHSWVLNGRRVPGLVKRIQSGTVSVGASGSGTATILAVSTDESILIHLGQFTGDTNALPAKALCYLDLTNSTTITGTKRDTVSTVTVSYLVVEFFPGVIRKIQRGSVSFGGGTSTTVTISAVDVAKTAVFPCGSNTDGVTNDTAYPAISVTNSTTLTFTKGAAGGTFTIPYQVVEFN